MLKIENDNIEVIGSAKDILKEWAELSSAICDGLSKELGVHVGLQELIDGSTMYLQKEELEKMSKKKMLKRIKKLEEDNKKIVQALTIVVFNQIVKGK